MLDPLKDQIKKDNSLMNFLKIPEEFIEKKYCQKNLEELDEKIAYYLTEEYTKDCFNSRLQSILKDSFYKVKPLIPRRIQIGLRKRYLLFQKKTPFPSWPIDLSLYETYKNGIKEIAKSANLNEIPFINFWPENKKFAFILTHDVETGTGQKNIWRVKEIEEDLGFRSSWNFVPEKYPLDEGLIQELKTSGFEVGIHGLKHDEKLFKKRKYFFKKAPKINYYLKKYDCSGFRAPMTWRNYEYMQHLDIQYDLSFFDSDIFEGQAGGTLSFHPFILGKFVELPYTLPQDFTLFILLGERDDKIWESKVEVIKQFQGMVLMNTHPDYLIKKDLLKIYWEFLMKMKIAPGYWHALPKEVAEWWIGRANCLLERSSDQWKITPPLKEGSIGRIRIEGGEPLFS